MFMERSRCEKFRTIYNYFKNYRKTFGGSEWGWQFRVLKCPLEFKYCNNGIQNTESTDNLSSWWRELVRLAAFSWPLQMPTRKGEGKQRRPHPSCQVLPHFFAPLCNRTPWKSCLFFNASSVISNPLSWRSACPNRVQGSPLARSNC